MMPTNDNNTMQTYSDGTSGLSTNLLTNPTVDHGLSSSLMLHSYVPLFYYLFNVPFPF